MGIQCDFFVADHADALQYDQLMRAGELPSASRYQRREWKSLTTLEIETLWAIIDRRPWTPDDGVLEFLGDEGDGETWLARFPAPLVASLAALAGGERVRIISEWSVTEEMASPPEEVAPIVDCLVDLARTASEKGRGLYLWGSV